MEDKELNQLLKNALSTDFEPDDELNTKIIKNVRENEYMKVRKIRKLSVAVVTCFALVLCSGTALAAWKYLKPAEVVFEVGNEQLAAAFESTDAILMDESQSYGEYTFTLLGAVSGSNLIEFCSDGDQVSSARTYAVVAISRKDGASMPKISDNEYGQESFLVSPLIQGLDPIKYNIVTMNGGYFDIVRDGIMYRVIGCDSVELFSDRTLYLSICNGTFYDRDAYVFNQETGEISVNSSYEGMNLLFELPLDSEKADEEAAEKYLKELAISQNPDPLGNAAASDEKADKEVKNKVDINVILNNWTLAVEQKVTPDKEGRIYYSYDIKSGSGDGFITEDTLFAKDETGYSKFFNVNEDNSYKNALVYYRDDKGEITVSVYEIEK